MDRKLYNSLVTLKFNITSKVLDYLSNMNTDPKYITIRAFSQVALPNVGLLLLSHLTKFMPMI